MGGQDFCREMKKETTGVPAPRALGVFKKIEPNSSMNLRFEPSFFSNGSASRGRTRGTQDLQTKMANMANGANNSPGLDGFSSQFQLGNVAKGAWSPIISPIVRY